MAEIDRIKALAGLLDDCDDDLFPSEDQVADIAVDDAAVHKDAVTGNRAPLVNVCSNTASEARSANCENRMRHGLTKNDRHDDILKEMQDRKLVANNSTRKMDGDNRTRAAAARTESEARRVLGRPRLTVVVDRDLTTNSSYETASSHSDAQESASPSESDLIFGRPETFGAAGGLSTSRMPNVKERAVAISAWKILEMKKERKNGHARAMEWSCLGSANGHGDYYGESGGQGDYYEENENVPKNGQSREKKSIPSFLAHFDTNVEEDTENSVNGVMLSPKPGTPLGKRVPLSPRNVEARDIGVGPKKKNFGAGFSPRNVLSPRNVGVGASPRNSGNVGVSPRNILGPRNNFSNQGFGKPNSEAPSPRNTFVKTGNTLIKPGLNLHLGGGADEVLSPRSKSLLTPSKAFNEGVKQTGPEKKTDDITQQPSGTKAMEFKAISDAKKAEVKMSETKVEHRGGEGELAVALQRRFAKIQVDSSLIVDDDEEDRNGCDGNEIATYNDQGKPELVSVVKVSKYSPAEPSQVTTFNDEGKPEFVSVFKETTYSPAKGYNAPTSRVIPSSVPDNTKPSPLEEAFHKVVGFKAGTKPGSDAVSDSIKVHKAPAARYESYKFASSIDTTIDDTLEDAARFLKSMEHMPESILDENHNTSSKTDIDSKCNEELSSAAELARYLDTLLVDSDSSVEEEVDEAADMTAVEETDSTELVGNCTSMESDEVDGGTNEVKDENDLVGEHEHERTSNDCRGHEENQDVEPEVSKPKKEWDEWNLTFTTSQLDQNFVASSDDNSFFHVEVAEDAVAQFVPPVKALPPPTSKVGGQRKLPKIKIAIDGAPAFHADEHKITTDSPMFFCRGFSSPSCGDNAGLLQSQPRTPSAEKGTRAKTRTHLVSMNNHLKGLLNHTLPSKYEKSKDGQSPSATGLLAKNENAASMEMDENVGSVIVQSHTLQNDQFGHFFVGALYSPTSTQTNTKGSDKKKKKGIFQRITSPLLSGRKVGRMGFNDDASI